LEDLNLLESEPTQGFALTAAIWRKLLGVRVGQNILSVHDVTENIL